LWGGEDPSLELKNQDQRSFDVFPNPSKGIIYIVQADLISEIEIYSIEGKLFYKGPSKDYIDLSHLEEGIYLLNAKKKIGGELFSKIYIY
jgi:hypothetical protein